MAPGVIGFLERLGRSTASGVAEVGFGAALFFESLYWTVLGRARRQPVRLGSVVAECMEIGIRALPIVTVLSFTIGVMLAIQGIYSLRQLGAEAQVVIGIAFAIVREFSPLITGILVAGRSGSALAARLGTMKISQELDALTVMGVNPVRFLVVPALLAMLIMVPCLSFWSMLVALFGSGVYVALEIGTSLPAFATDIIDLLRVNDLTHGLGKSVIFAALVAMIGVVNGALVTGGAEGVGRMTTRSVVQSISAIVITDMIFVFMVTRGV